MWQEYNGNVYNQFEGQVIWLNSISCYSNLISRYLVLDLLTTARKQTITDNVPMT